MPASHQLSPWRFVLRVADRRQALVAAVLAILGALSEGIGLLLLVPIIGMATGREVMAIPGFPDLQPELSLNAWLAVFVIVVTLRAAIVQARITQELRLHLSIVKRLRGDLFRAFLHADWRFLAPLTRGSAVNGAMNVVEELGRALQYFASTLSSVVTLAILFVVSFVIAPVGTMVLVAGSVIVLALFSGLRRRAAAEGDALSDAWRQFFEYFDQRFGAIRAVKAFGRESTEERYSASLTSQINARRIAFRKGIGTGQFLLQAGAATALATAIMLASRSAEVPLDHILPLVALCARAVPLVSDIQNSWQQIAHDTALAREYQRLLVGAREATERPQRDSALVKKSGSNIALSAASVRWPGRELAALGPVSLVFPAGSTTAIVGASGAGKSTLADVLSGMMVPDSGTIALDGRPLEAEDLAGWRRLVGYVQQDPFLLNGSVRENLAWAAPDADEAAMTRALAQAAAQFALALPQGLDTPVGESGRQFSGGERQRIAMARVLLRQPELLILDEATSALDAASEAVIVEALRALKGTMTIVIICHRGALFDLADRVVELANGKVVRDSVPA